MASDDQYLILDTFEREIRIPVGDIRSVEMGFSGTDVCMKVEVDGGMICDRLLHLISPTQIILLKGKGFLEIEKLSPTSLVSLHWKKTKSNRILPFLRKEITVTVKMINKEISGIILEIENNSLQLRTEEKVFTINESEILELSYFAPPPITFLSVLNLHSPTDLIPGYPQFQSGNRTKGTFLMGAGFLALSGAAWQFDAARKNSRAKYSFIPVGNTILLEQDSRSRKQSYQNIRNSNALGALFLIILSYHLWDHSNSDLIAWERSYPEDSSYGFLTQNSNLAYFAGLERMDVEEHFEIFRFQISF